MATKFTINQDEANMQSGKLLRISAIVFSQHERKPNSMGTCGFPLPAAMTFITEQDISRKKLTKLFGKAAMVRGVKKI